MIKDYGGNLGEGLLHLPGKFIGIGQPAAVYDETQHDPSVNSRLPQIKMPQQPLAGSFIIDGDTVRIGIAAHPSGNLAEQSRLEGTIPAGDNGMAARRIKAGIAAVFIPAKGELRLIAVTVMARGG